MSYDHDHKGDDIIFVWILWMINIKWRVSGYILLTYTPTNHV